VLPEVTALMLQVIDLFAGCRCTFSGTELDPV